MVTPIRKKDGKFAGSIGDGKKKTPQPAKPVPTISTPFPSYGDTVLQVLDMTEGGYKKICTEYMDASAKGATNADLVKRYLEAKRYHKEALTRPATGRLQAANLITKM